MENPAISSRLSLGPPRIPPVPTLTHTLSYLHTDGGSLHADSPLAQTKPLFWGGGVRVRNSGPKEMEDVNCTSDPKQGHPHMARLTCEAQRWQARGQSSSTSMRTPPGHWTRTPVSQTGSHGKPGTHSRLHRTGELTGPTDGVPLGRDTHSPTRQTGPAHPGTHILRPAHSQQSSLAATHTLNTHTNPSVLHTVLHPDTWVCL